MKEKIIELRQKGYSYNQIVKRLGCSKGTVSYHLGKGQKEKNKLRNKLFKKTRKEYLINFSWRYKKLCGCKNCGNKNPVVLEFDHIDRKSKIRPVSHLINEGYSLSVVKEEIRKCDVLCANCHRIRTAKQLNYHKQIWGK